MKVPEWMRKLPHPEYGNYGGANRRCKTSEQEVCPLPIDDLDQFSNTL